VTHIDTLVFVMMLDEGIIPFSWPPQGPFDVSLSTLPDFDATASKRKFRKLWKRAAKLEMKNSIHFSNIMRSCGTGLPEKDIRPHHRLYRSRIVYKMFLKKAMKD